MAMAGSDRPWRLALGSPACVYSAGCGSLLVPIISLSVSLFSLLAPFVHVGERGAWSSVVLLPAVVVSFPIGCGHRLLREGGGDAMSVWIV